MKRTIPVLIFSLMALGLCAQSKPGRFADVDLSKLRRTVLKQLTNDDLISGRKETVYVFLRPDGVSINDEALPQEASDKYVKLLAPFEIGTGPNRAVLVSKDCTAVGDFTEDSFTGKSEGSLRLAYTQETN